jgi:hypothetical protein
MRPLNRPMFKMGGPVKEGIMDGIREPKANGGTIGGGTIVGEDKGGGRTGFVNPLFLAGGAIAARAAPLLSRAKNIFGRNVQIPFTPVARQTITTGGKNPGTMLGGFKKTGPTTTRTEFQQSGLGKFFTQDPTIKAITSKTPGKVSGALKSALPFVDPRKGFLSALGFSYAAPAALDIVAGAPNQALRVLPDYIEDPLRDLIGLERPGTKSNDPKVVSAGGVGQVKQPGTVDTKTVPENQQGGKAISDKFNDDGTEKSSSVENLLNAVRKRSREGATGDALIAAGERIRTGGIDSDTVGDVIKSTSQAFDKDSELRQRLDLAQIESELKKEQIRAQSIATNKIIQGAKMANIPVSTAARREFGLPTTLLEYKMIVDKANPGSASTAQGTESATRTYVKEILGDSVAYQGIIGDVKKQNALFKKDEFKTDPLGTISEVIQGLPNGPGGSGVYVLGTSVYLYDADTKTATALD